MPTEAVIKNTMIEALTFAYLLFKEKEVQPAIDHRVTRLLPVQAFIQPNI